VKVLFPIYAFVGFLLSLAVCAIVVGIHDASLARASLGVTAGSAVLLVVGVMLLIGAYKLARLTRRGLWHGETRPSCGPLVVSALLLATLVGVYVFFSAIRTAGPQRPVVVAVALMIVAFAATGLRFFGSEARVTLPRLGTIALGLIGTTIGAWEFWYQNQYVPSRAGRAVELNFNLDLVAHQPKHEVIQATVSYQGIGGRSVSVIGSTYTLTCSRVVRCERRRRGKQSEPSSKASCSTPKQRASRLIYGSSGRPPCSPQANSLGTENVSSLTFQPAVTSSSMCRDGAISFSASARSCSLSLHRFSSLRARCPNTKHSPTGAHTGAGRS
jgi:hypothetical protein